MAVKEGDIVKIDYEGTFDDGKVFDTTKGKDPIEFEVGKHMVIKGFEDAVVGMERGGEKTIKLKPEEAYGIRNEKLVQELPRDKIPTDMEFKPGMMLMFKGPQGQKIASVVTNVTDNAVTVDLNHPLAGKNLNFKLKVVDVKEGKK